MKKLFMAIGMILFFLISINTQTFAQEDPIHGCYSKKNGKLRIVSAPNVCKKGEESIDWNRTGPQGEQGEQGPQGPPGICGGIYVYDSSDPPQYLGILVELGHPYADTGFGIFIPSLRTIAYFNVTRETDRWDKLGDIRRCEFVRFEGESCTGKVYMKGSYIPNSICRTGESGNNARYFIGGFPPSIEGPIPSLSWINPTVGDCINITEDIDRVFQTTEIPAENIPFNLPVTLPLFYQTINN